MDKIKAWYGPGGALVLEAPLDDLADLLDPESAAFYGGPYFLAESMHEATARRICEALHLDYRGLAERA